MLGTLVNSTAIILGSIIGIIIKQGIKDEYKKTVMDGVGLSVIIIGIMGAIKSENTILVIISVVLGSIIGETIGIEKKLNSLGDKMEKRFGKGDSNFSKGFVTASLVYCVGAMAIVGSLESGLLGDHNTLFAKSILDGISSIIFASTLGIGVAFSAMAVFIYQGLVTILATYLKEFLTPEVILEMSAVGGILIMAIGINILELKKIKVGNMLPAIFIPLIYYVLVSIFAF
ncbi:conserved membrane hypothetical protein [[Clostridium] ultunense Esp]|uniref:Transport protein n=1 Tax=[Clostridium] ultunense Esp TaxID=1288971 RepID=M1Z906_9FIRM|nr:DUF554 domain-containing protein [Schnuerera ultunensis]CCQ94576.1 conserved membrane hypothetical protein [[Clostridium] ultunense Esp]SHD76754.1 conserved membrane protein of unknown function [[Clostridium] ultunense Esp]